MRLKIEIKVITKVRNPYYEACYYDSEHPYHDKLCDKRCPDYEFCRVGPEIEIEMTLREYLRYLIKKKVSWDKIFWKLYDLSRDIGH